MEDLLTKLYYGQIDIANKKPDKKRSSKEDELYDKLEKSFSKEQFEVFQSFLMAYADRYSDYQEYAFKQGVKVGFELSIEIKNIKI